MSPNRKHHLSRFYFPRFEAGFVDVAQAADLFGVCKRTIRNWDKQGAPVEELGPGSGYRAAGGRVPERTSRQGLSAQNMQPADDYRGDLNSRGHGSPNPPSRSTIRLQNSTQRASAFEEDDGNPVASRDESPVALKPSAHDITPTRKGPVDPDGAHPAESCSVAEGSEFTLG